MLIIIIIKKDNKWLIDEIKVVFLVKFHSFSEVSMDYTSKTKRSRHKTCFTCFTFRLVLVISGGRGWGRITLTQMSSKVCTTASMQVATQFNFLRGAGCAAILLPLGSVQAPPPSATPSTTTRISSASSSSTVRLYQLYNNKNNHKKQENQWCDDDETQIILEINTYQLCRQAVLMFSKL